MPLGTGFNASFITQDKDAQKLVCKGREMVWYSHYSTCAKNSLIPGKGAASPSHPLPVLPYGALEPNPVWSSTNEHAPLNFTLD